LGKKGTSDGGSLGISSSEDSSSSYEVSPENKELNYEIIY